MEKAETSRNSGTIATLARTVLVIAGGVSIVVFLAVLYLWVRSYFIAEVVYFKPVAAPEEFASPMPNKPGRWQFQWNISSCAGKAQVVRRNLGIGEETSPGIQHLRPDVDVLTVLTRQDPLDLDWRFGGIEYFRRDRQYGNRPPVRYWHWGFLIVTVPYWLVALVTAILPTIVGLRLMQNARQRRRIARGMCHYCGYDLRGGGGICPECGTEVEAVGAAVRR